MKTYKLQLVIGGGEFTSRVEARSIDEAVKLFRSKPHLQEYSEQELKKAISIEE